MVARAIEASGIPTIGIGQMKGVMQRIGYPRALVTTHPRGETIGAPKDYTAQRRVLDAALALLMSAQSPRELQAFEPSAASSPSP
ncbi:MAG: hypothetical protein ABR577_00175 [Pyrinomonadaceae bacterium]